MTPVVIRCGVISVAIESGGEDGVVTFRDTRGNEYETTLPIWDARTLAANIGRNLRITIALDEEPAP